MRPLTERQRRVLEFIEGFCAERGFPPTQAEIAEGMGFRSANAAAEHVRLLRKKGVLEVTPGRARGIRLVERGGGLPVVGEVAAGEPILAEERVERRLDVAPGLFRPRADYLLRVRGDSMIEAGILPRDLVAVHRCPEVATGSIAVVRLDDEVTVKRWRRRGRQVVLEPAHPEMKPRVIDPRRTNVVIEGRVVGLLRLPEEVGS